MYKNPTSSVRWLRISLFLKIMKQGLFMPST